MGAAILAVGATVSKVKSAPLPVPPDQIHDANGLHDF